VRETGGFYVGIFDFIADRRLAAAGPAILPPAQRRMRRRLFPLHQALFLSFLPDGSHHLQDMSGHILQIFSFPQRTSAVSTRFRL
jgi:hypothetical protein